MAVTIDGLVTGLDTQSIIDGLLKIQKQQVDRFTLRKDDVQQKKTAFNGVETRLLSLQLDISKLSRTQSNSLTRQKVSVNDETAISGSATDSAASGVYRFTVNSRAAAHQVASQGFSDADSEITTGTFDLRLGNGDVSSITVDESNNTVAGLANAINAAKSGVTANVIKDSSGSATPWKLVLTSSKSGTENSISLTNNLAASSGDAVRPEIDFITPVQAAADAEITFGSGAGAISTTSATDRFSDVIRGVSFDLLNPTIGQEVAITVERDTSTAVQDVQAFVDSFNEVVDFIDDQSSYVPSTNEGGPLLGNRSVQTIKQKLYSTILAVVPGVPSSINRLSSIGITVTDKGRLELDSTRLKSILDGQVEGVSATDVKRLFALDGSSDNPGVTFVSGSPRTNASSTPVQVNITQAAEQAALTAGTALNESVIIGAANNGLTVKINGAEATVTLASGTYSRQELADLVETTLNSASTLAGRSVSTRLVDSHLKITSDSYGSASKIEIVSGSALSDLGLSAATLVAGKDVQGSFSVGGLTETATGKGQLLTGDEENTNTSGLLIRVSLSPSSVSSGITSQMTVTRGVGASLSKLFDDILSSENGLTSTANSAFDAQLSDLQASIDRQQSVFNRQQEQLLKQFSALESAISTLQSTGSYVASQLASLNGISG
jgi:flagellar hook-associated protein 2